MFTRFDCLVKELRNLSINLGLVISFSILFMLLIINYFYPFDNVSCDLSSNLEREIRDVLSSDENTKPLSNAFDDIVSIVNNSNRVSCSWSDYLARDFFPFLACVVAGGMGAWIRTIYRRLQANWAYGIPEAERMISSSATQEDVNSGDETHNEEVTHSSSVVSHEDGDYTKVPRHDSNREKNDIITLGMITGIAVYLLFNSKFFLSIILLIYPALSFDIDSPEGANFFTTNLASIIVGFYILNIFDWLALRGISRKFSKDMEPK